MRTDAADREPTESGIDVIHESNPLNHVGQQRAAVQATPMFLGGQRQLKNHRHSGIVVSACVLLGIGQAAASGQRLMPWRPLEPKPVAFDPNAEVAQAELVPENWALV